MAASTSRANVIKTFLKLHLASGTILAPRLPKPLPSIGYAWQIQIASVPANAGRSNSATWIRPAGNANSLQEVVCARTHPSDSVSQLTSLGATNNSFHVKA